MYYSVISFPVGEISSRNVSVTGTLNEFFYQQCTWVLDSNVERQLFIDIFSEQVTTNDNTLFYFS